MGSRTTIQLLLIIVGIVIIMTYIQPTFNDMRATQDETQEYRNALDNAAKFNSELQRLVNTANSFSTSERRALDRYLPREVDTIAVMRDIETITENNQMQLLSLDSVEVLASRSFTAAQGQSNTRAPQVSAESFTLQVAGTYEQFKTLLQDFERNAYPLEVTLINFTPTDGQSYSFSLTLETYALSESESTGVTEVLE